GRNAVRAEHCEGAIRLATGGVPGMGEDGEEAEVPRWRPRQRPYETPPGHLRQHGTEGIRRDRRPGCSECQADLRRARTSRRSSSRFTSKNESSRGSTERRESSRTKIASRRSTREDGDGNDTLVSASRRRTSRRRYT